MTTRDISKNSPTKLAVYELLLDWTGDWGSRYGHHGYYWTKRRAEKALDRLIKENKGYRPHHRIDKKILTIE